MTQLVVAAMWLLVGARWLWAWGEDASSLRGRVTRGLTWLAVTVTVLAVSGRIDRWLGIPNVSAAVRRVTVGCAWLVAQNFMLAILRAHGCGVSLARQLHSVSRAATWIMMVSSLGLWFVAFPHDRELSMLNSEPSMAATWFLLITYLWIVGICASMAYVGLRGVLSSSTDLPGRVFAGLMTASGIVGLLGGVCLALTRVLHPGTTIDPERGLTLPATGALASLAILSVPVVEWWQARRAAGREVQRLQEQWRHVVARHPEVVLRIPWYQRWLNVPLVAERMRIEVLDGVAAEAANGVTA